MNDQSSTKRSDGRERAHYEKPAICRHGNLREIVRGPSGPFTDTDASPKKTP